MRPALPLLAALVASAGCVDLLFDPDPIEPASGRTAWTTAQGDPWIAVTTGCGFCIADPDVPQAETVVFYETGEVLWYRFGFGSKADDARVETVPALEKYNATVRRVAAALDAGDGYYHGRNLRVHEAAASRLSDAERDAVVGFLDDAVQAAEDPGPPNYDCQDCAGIHVDVFGQPGFDVVLSYSEDPDYGNVDEGDPWDRIADQMNLLEAWARQWEEP